MLRSCEKAFFLPGADLPLRFAPREGLLAAVLTQRQVLFGAPVRLRSHAPEPTPDWGSVSGADLLRFAAQDCFVFPFIHSLPRQAHRLRLRSARAR